MKGEGAEVGVFQSVDSKVKPKAEVGAHPGIKAKAEAKAKSEVEAEAEAKEARERKEIEEFQDMSVDLDQPSVIAIIKFLS